MPADEPVIQSFLSTFAMARKAILHINRLASLCIAGTGGQSGTIRQYCVISQCNVCSRYRYAKIGTLISDNIAGDNNESRNQRSTHKRCLLFRRG